MREGYMDAQKALNKIKWDTPLKAVENIWQYEKEINTLQAFIDNHIKLIKGIQALGTLEKLNVKVLLQAIDHAKTD